MPNQSKFTLFLTLFLLLSLSFGCRWLGFKDKSADPNPGIMNDQVNTIPDQPYAAEWAAVDSLEKQGLIRSALEKVDAIHARAKADNIPAQAIKALVFWGKYTTQLEDDGFEKTIQRFESELATAGILQKAILNSLTGQLYTAYLQTKAWEIRQRTETATPGDDIRTWSVGQLQKRAFDLYVASVSAKQGLIREMSAADFKDILTPGLGDSIGGDPLRPTLYDLLAHRALDFLVNEQNYLTEPVNLFELNQPEAFAPTADFVRFDFSNGDPNSGKFQAVKLLQQLSVRPERTEVYSDGTPSKTFRNIPSQIHVDLVRLKFAWNNSTLENKKDYYRSALETLHDRYASHPASAEILYELAWFYYYETTAADEKPKANQKAVELLERAIQTAPGSYAAKISQSLLYDIRQQYLTCEVERAWLPEKPVLVKLNFRNVNSTYVKVVRASHDINEWETGYEWDKRMAWLMAQKTVQTRTWNIPDPKDFQMHSTEIALDALPLGNYWVICAENADFDHHKSPVSFAHFTVTRLAGVSFNERVPGQLFVLADRETGAPLANVQLECFQKPNGQNNPQWKLTQTQKTDAQGMVRIQMPVNQMAEVRAVLGTDSFLLSSAYQYEHYENEDNTVTAHFFTDRIMYRPGQTVFFKTIVYKKDKEGRPQIMPKHNLTVKFLDVNGQEKGSKSLTTNEFGTFNGSFTAPASGLTGFMSIVAEGVNGGTSFSVEEYKLARFEVVMKPLEGNYRLDEKVNVTGEAKNYAGSAVSDAAVRYRVVRTPRFPYINYDYTRIIPNFFESPEREIANGTTTTDANGLFSIPFTLKADKSIPKSVQPLFEYKVTVDITDISGETRSGESWLHAAYSALDVALEMPNEIHLDSLKKVGLTVNNMAGKPQPASGTITLQQLVEPAVMPIQRFWDAPDVQTMDKATFKRNFPQFAYGNEAEPSSWDRADFIVPFTFNTANGNSVNLSNSTLRAGWYLLVLETKDTYGEAVKIERYIRVFDHQKRFTTPKARPEKNHYEPGETAKIQLGGQAENLNFFIAREQNGVLVNPTWAKSSVMDWRVTEADRGGILYHYIAIKNNRQYRENGVAVTVPWSNKELKISYESFRDKLAPGQKEEWRIRISGPNKEKVAAEMVATLYDASLDQYNPHGWQRIDFPMRYSEINVVDGNNFTISGGDYLYMPGVVPENGVRMFQEINWFDFPMWGRMMYRTRAMAVGGAAPEGMADMAAAPVVEQKKSMQKDSEEIMDVMATSTGGDPNGPPAQLRRNLNETVFFFPEIRTDANGDVVLRFTMNESLTRWNLFTFAHTKDLQQVLSTKSVVTQKELMVISNPPRFLRAGDEFEFAAKVSNLSQESLSGTATLNLLDANTLQPLETAFGLGSREARVSNFSIQPGQSAPLTWRFKVPEDFTGAVTWQIFADGKKWRDGEENTLPVVSNRMLVTETMPITVRGNQRKTFTFEPLKNIGQSSTLTPHNLTLEFTSNPVWYAVQALPYLMEYPYECSEQVFSRFYANTLASSVTQKMPNIRRIYDRWKGTDALKSNLSKNQELKTALLEETPWVMDAQNEAQQKQNIALLFDLNRMSDERERALNTLTERQYEDGSWPWFAGGPGSWHITQHIASGMGHLAKLGAFDLQNNEQVTQMVDKALGFCDAQVRRHYEELLRQAEQQKVKLEDDHLDGLMIQYLYTRSFSPVDRPSPELAYYLGQAETHWLKKGIYEQGMLALALNRYGRKDAAMRIVASLRERATVKEELGMFWPVSWGYYWYQLPIETQAIMVEVFSEVANDRQAVEELRIWLLKNKQTNRWESTKATAEAVYALLLNGDNWLENSKPVEVSLSGKVLKIKEYEAGTGYFKQNWSGKEITKSMSSIEVKNPNSNIAWGGAYFQYFEDLDQIKNFQETPLKIVKQLYLEENSPTGPILKPVAEGATLKRGDKLKVRIEIRVDRAMEYVHLKDMRAAGLEPINVLSQYKWQDGLGYYESTKDLATHFFIDYLPKGTFVFEYPVVVSHRGNMSNGITTMQCMYAPEFSSHSKGVRIKVD